MSEYIKKSSIIGLAHKLRFGRILTDREVEVVEMVVNSVHDDARVDLVRCQECKWYQMTDDGDMACVKDADEQDGTYFGFIQVTAPEWFCADGECKGVEE